mmetsp:Transcript_28494/g.40204  ORF Transcript_28494/g.40204 Transcript_28494/m.40204 type:complete len:83 (-) Transcript_28494:434-682(-)
MKTHIEVNTIKLTCTRTFTDAAVTVLRCKKCVVMITNAQQIVKFSKAGLLVSVNCSKLEKEAFTKRKKEKNVGKFDNYFFLL